MIALTGELAHWAPEGFSVYVDTSWDRRGEHIAVRDADVLWFTKGEASSLSRVKIRDGSPVLRGEDVFALFPDSADGQRPMNGGLGYSWDPQLTASEAEAVFVAKVRA